MSEWREWVGWGAGIVGGLVGAIVGIRSFFKADAASVDAKRAADALEEANRIRLEENPPERPPWGDARWVSGELFAIKNDSARSVVVTGIESDSDRLAGLLRHRRAYPTTVDAGDTIEVMAIGTMGGRPNPIILWHWERDASNVQRTRRSLSKPK